MSAEPVSRMWPERAIRVAEALEHEVTTMRSGSLWCRLCDRDIGEDGQDHAPHCVLYNEDPDPPSSREDELEGALRSLASYVGAGGYNAPAVDPALFEDKIRWGIDHLIDAAIQRCADVIEEQSKNYARSTWGSARRAILDLKSTRDSDGRPQAGDALAAPLATSAGRAAASPDNGVPNV